MCPRKNDRLLVALLIILHFFWDILYADKIVGGLRLSSSNTKSTDAQGKLKPRSVIMREEGELGFLIIPRAQPAG